MCIIPELIVQINKPILLTQVLTYNKTLLSSVYIYRLNKTISLDLVLT